VLKDVGRVGLKGGAVVGATVLTGGLAAPVLGAGWLAREGMRAEQARRAAGRNHATRVETAAAARAAAERAEAARARATAGGPGPAGTR
jgi:hypothetical protein